MPAREILADTSNGSRWLDLSGQSLRKLMSPFMNFGRWAMQMLLPLNALFFQLIPWRPATWAVCVTLVLRYRCPVVLPVAMGSSGICGGNMAGHLSVDQESSTLQCAYQISCNINVLLRLRQTRIKVVSMERKRKWRKWKAFPLTKPNRANRAQKAQYKANKKVII